MTDAPGDTRRVPRDLLILASAFCFIFMGTSALQPLLVELLDAARAPIVLAVVYFSFLVFRLFVPATIHALSDYGSIIAGAMVYAGFALTLALTHNFAILLFAACVWGWGAASLWTASTVQVVDVSKRYGYGSASGVFYMAALGGQALGALLLGVVLDRAGAAATVWTAMGISTVGVAVALAVPRRNPPRESFSLVKVLRLAVASRATLVGVLLLCSSLSYGVLLGPVQTAVKALLERKWLLGLVPFAFYATKSILSYAGGSLSDRVGRAAVVRCGFLIAAVGLVVGALWPTVAAGGWWGLGPGWIGAASLVFCSFALALQNALVPTAAAAILGDAAVGQRRHMVMTAMFVWRDLGVVLGLLGGLALKAVGPASAEGTMRVTFLSFAAVFVLCSFLASMLKRLRGATI